MENEPQAIRAVCCEIMDIVSYLLRAAQLSRLSRAGLSFMLTSPDLINTAIGADVLAAPTIWVDIVTLSLCLATGYYGFLFPLHRIFESHSGPHLRESKMAMESVLQFMVVHNRG
jgi:hypothetical protein